MRLTPNNNRRGVEPPEALIARARELIAEHGVRGAARKLNLSREATLGLAAGAPVDRGTLSLAERALESTEEKGQGGQP
jgi:hypothetical protein